MEFRFASPLWLWLLAALPVLAAWQILVVRRRRGTMRYSDLGLLGGLSAAPTRLLMAVPPVLRHGALALMILAMARPQAGNVRRDVLNEGVDIILVLDCSGSMDTPDFYPNRLEAAKEVISQFIAGRETDRIGLVVFGEESFTVCPLTVDYHALTDLLDRVHIGVVPPDGTAIGKGLLNAIHRLEGSEAKSKVVVLLTDGDNNRGIDPATVAQLAGDLGIKVYAIGVGTPEGRGPTGGFNPGLLQQMANVTKGRYFHATDRDSLAAIYREIDQMEKTQVQFNVYAQWNELMAWFIWPALLLFGLEISLRQTRLVTVP
jgi:Ca-activated chloride channel family protein